MDSKINKKALGLCVVLVSLASLGLCSCSYLNEKLGLQDDNIFEEHFEASVKSKYGFDLDFTPKTPEGGVNGKTARV